MNAKAGWMMAALLCALSALPASAQTRQQQIDNCGKNLEAPDLAIVGCTALIQSRNYKGLNLAGVFFTRGIAYSRKDDFERAIADYSESIKLDPKDAIAFNMRCWTRGVVGKLEDALRDCNEALRLSPNNSNMLKNRGFVHLKSGAIDKAMTDFDASLRISPGQPDSIYGRGLAKRKQGDIAGGDADIREAIRTSAFVAEAITRYGLQ